MEKEVLLYRYRFINGKPVFICNTVLKGDLGIFCFGTVIVVGTASSLIVFRELITLYTIVDTVIDIITKLAAGYSELTHVEST